MKRAAGLAALLLLAGAAQAAGRPVIFTQIEYWLEDDAFEKDEEGIDQVKALGADKAEIDISGGVGGRFGVFIQTAREGLEWGGSLGYIKGPEADVSIFNAAPAGTVEANAETSFWRLLLELRQRARVRDGLEVRLRGGLGVARGEIEASGTSTGIFFLPGPDTVKNDWTGFTWEITPSIAFVGERMALDIGIALAGFPKMKENDDFNEFEWMPIGFRVGLEF